MTDSITENSDILYHYTTLDGLLGILNSKNLWATNICYLNDSREFMHTIDLVKKAVAKSIMPYSSNKLMYSHLDSIYESINQIFNTIPIINYGIYVTSFSKKGDLLSQWRGYCPLNSGCSIGIRMDTLNKIANENGFSLVECDYKLDKQSDEIMALVNDIITSEPEMFKPSVGKPISQDQINRVVYDIYRSSARIAPKFKDESFSEEKEWRLIPNDFIDYRSEQVNFRAGKSSLIPYIDIKLNVDTPYVPIEEIIVGPTHHISLSVSAVEQLLHRLDIPKRNVIPSRIPYRTL